MHVCLWWVFLPFKLLSLRFLPYSPDFRFNPRQYVNNTDTFIGCQDLFFFFCPSSWQDFYLVHCSGLRAFLPPSSLLSHGCFQTDPRPMCTRCPHPSKTTAAAAAPSRSLSLLTPLFDTDRWNCYQRWLLSVSASVSHTPCCLFCLLLSYPVPSKKTSKEREKD